MTHEGSTTPRPEQANGVEQFSAVAQTLLQVIQTNPGYYQKPAFMIEGGERVDLGIDKGAEAMQELDSAKTQLEQGELLEPIHIRLFGGFQGRDISRSKEWGNNAIVGDLYDGLSSLAGEPPSRKGYYGLERHIKELADDQSLINKSASLRFVVGRRANFALTDDRRNLVGLQLKISDNIYATFRLANFGDPADAFKGLSYVLLDVVPFKD